MRNARRKKFLIGYNHCFRRVFSFNDIECFQDLLYGLFGLLLL